MNKEELIQSGLLELYVLGQCTESEMAIVDSFQSDEDVRKELKDIELALIPLAQLKSVQPRAEVKAKLMMSILNSEASATKVEAIQEKAEPTKVVEEAKLISINKKSFAWRIAAGFMLLVSIGLFTIYSGRLNQLDEKLTALTQEKESIRENYNQVKQVSDELSGVEDFFAEKLIKSYELKHPSNPNEIFGVLYWCPATGEIMLNGMDMPKLTDQEQYQLWALVDGKPLDLGVLPKDWDGETNKLAHLKGVKELSAYAITIEPLGGKPTPTLEKLTALAEI